MNSSLRYPLIKIDLAKIKHNARRIVEASKVLNVRITGVTKACLGDPFIARAMLEVGVEGIADSRILNLEKLYKEGFVNLLMLRQPLKNEVKDAVYLTQGCLVSDMTILNLLSVAATRAEKRYRAVLMVETGEMREGIVPRELPAFVAQARKLPYIEIWGIGTNFACFSSRDETSLGEKPSIESLSILCEAAEELKKKLDFSPSVISGGNSSAWRLIESKNIPPQINHLRMGEAILLGQETLSYRAIPNTFQDAFVLEGEVIEVREKPLNLLNTNKCETRKQVLVALGRQDIGAGYLTPYFSGLKPLKISSDHLVLEDTEGLNIRVGNILSFKPDYQALVGAMTSPFVQKVYLNKGDAVHSLLNRGVRIFDASPNLS